MSKKILIIYFVVICSRGSDTVLGETSDPQELFVMDECENSVLRAISGKAIVKHLEIPSNWSELGGSKVENLKIDRDNGNMFYYQKRYTDILLFYQLR